MAAEACTRSRRQSAEMRAGVRCSASIARPSLLLAVQTGNPRCWRAHLAIGDTDRALQSLEQGAEKAQRHEPDPGFFALMNLRMNFAADPVLERPEFVEVRNRLRGD